MSFKPIHKSVYSIVAAWEGGGRVFLYLLKGDRIALVDTGVTHTPSEVLQPALAELGLALSDVDVILNTHGHLDHAGGNGEMKKLSKASIHMHPADLFMVQSADAQAEFMTAPLRALDYPAELVRARAQYTIRHSGEPVGADVLLSEGDAVDLGAGIRLRVIHNPGHTPGSISYYWESEGILFLGDGVQGAGSRPGAYPLYFDAPSYRRSLSKLSGLDLRMICLAHAYLGGTTINEPVKTGADCGIFLQGAIQVADTIHWAVAEAVKRMPGASKRDIALAALSELIYHIPQMPVRETGIPAQGGPALLSHINAALDGSYPA